MDRPLEPSILEITALTEVDFILEKRDRKRDALVTRGTNHIEKILTLSTEIVALHMQKPLQVIIIKKLVIIVKKIKTKIKIYKILR